MATEIERKFLVIGEKWRRLVTQSRRLRQAYLHADDRSSVRIRMEDDGRAFLTAKSAMGNVSRSEFEYDIPQSDALEMIKLRLGVIIEKIRHIVPAGSDHWELDEFEGDNAGLVIAEVELSDAALPIERPEWIGEEVTHDPRYYNARLALQPYGCWQTDRTPG